MKMTEMLDELCATELFREKSIFEEKFAREFG